MLNMKQVIDVINMEKGNADVFDQDGEDATTTSLTKLMRMVIPMEKSSSKAL